MSPSRGGRGQRKRSSCRSWFDGASCSLCCCLFVCLCFNFITDFEWNQYLILFSKYAMRCNDRVDRESDSSIALCLVLSLASCSMDDARSYDVTVYYTYRY